MAFDDPVQELTDLIRSRFPNAPIFYIADQRAGKDPWQGPDQLVEITEDALEDLALFHQRENVAWSCGDYCYVLALKMEWDFLWLIEPDVGFSGNSFSLLEEADATSVDLIGTRIGQRSERWSWTSRLRDASGEEKAFGVFFPLTRVSRRLAERIHEFRSSLTPVLQSDPSLRVPNDESVTATVAIKNDMTTLDLSHEHPEIFKHWGWRPKFQRSSVIRTGEDLISHPVISDEEFSAYAQKEIKETLQKAPIAEALALLQTETKSRLRVDL